ncbi:MAG: hypothetical protein V1773_03415 [bacterium]
MELVPLFITILIYSASFLIVVIIISKIAVVVFAQKTQESVKKPNNLKASQTVKSSHEVRRYTDTELKNREYEREKRRRAKQKHYEESSVQNNTHNSERRKKERKTQTGSPIKSTRFVVINYNSIYEDTNSKDTSYNKKMFYPSAGTIARPYNPTIEYRQDH